MPQVFVALNLNGEFSFHGFMLNTCLVVLNLINPPNISPIQHRTFFSVTGGACFFLSFFDSDVPAAILYYPCNCCNTDAPLSGRLYLQVH
jgi:hypothetical protein